jgi:hypothetical protein
LGTDQSREEALRSWKELAEALAGSGDSADTKLSAQVLKFVERTFGRALRDHVRRSGPAHEV